MPKTGRERLADYRWRTKLKQNELADLLGITDSYLSQILSGRRRPGRDIAARIEDETGVPVRAWAPTPSGKTRSRQPKLSRNLRVGNELTDVSNS